MTIQFCPENPGVVIWGVLTFIDVGHANGLFIVYIARDQKASRSISAAAVDFANGEIHGLNTQAFDQAKVVRVKIYIVHSHEHDLIVTHCKAIDE